MIMLDIKNAFNTASWDLITDELKRRRIPLYMQNLLESYLEDREIAVDGKSSKVTAGVPQGSVLGPTLWNILYNGALRIDLGEGTTTIGFADDLAILVRGGDRQHLEHRADLALTRITKWMEEHKLELAPEKTEVVILKGPWKKTERERPRFLLKGTQLKPQRDLKYLGIVLDDIGTFGKHIQIAVDKAEARLGTLSRLMRNTGGPQSKKRELLSGVVHSVLLYGAPIWEKAVNIGTYRKRLEKTQRKVALRVASAYRTTSLKAIQVITGTVPIHLQVSERGRIHRSDNGREAKSIQREVSLREWQQEWHNTTDVAQWTKSELSQMKYSGTNATTKTWIIT